MTLETAFMSGSLWMLMIFIMFTAFLTALSEMDKRHVVGATLFLAITVIAGILVLFGLDTLRQLGSLAS